MKRIGYGKRLIALVLALTMFASLVPSVANRALAAKVGDTFAGDTGLKGNINTKDTISWPIKIYDYLNDGMLFEYSSAEDVTISPHTGGSYGGGKPMPMIGDKILGQDYTSIVGYYNEKWDSSKGVYTYSPNYAFTKWGNHDAYSCRYDKDATEVVRYIQQPITDTRPMNLRLVYPEDATTTSKSYSWISNFAKDEGQYFSKEDIRYMVIVYKTNDVYSEKTNGKGRALRPYWAVSDKVYSSRADISDLSSSLGWKSGGDNPTGTLVAQEVQLKPSTGTWTYQIFDMKTNIQDDLLASGQSGYGIAENWSKIKSERIAGVGMSIPLAAAGEVLNVSHIAYFGSEAEANEFGTRAVEFDKDPGEYVGPKITRSYEDSGKSLTTTVKKRTLPPICGTWAPIWPLACCPAPAAVAGWYPTKIRAAKTNGPTVITAITSVTII